MEIPFGEGRFETVGEGVRLMPSMSDQYFLLLQDIRRGSHQAPQAVALPATSAILAVATIESYINELVGMAPFGESPNEKKMLQRELRQLGTDAVAKLRRLRTLAANPEGVSEDLLTDLGLLVGIRGLMVHFDPQGEHPLLTRTSMQRLCERIGIEVPKDNRDWASLPFLLTPALSDWCVEMTVGSLRGLFLAGYHPPRPRWYAVVRPDANDPPA